MKKIKKSVWF